MDTNTIVGIASVGEGVFWILAYLLIVRRGLIDKSFGMPIVAVCGNIAWEFIMIALNESCPIQYDGCNTTMFWVRGAMAFILDAGIVYTIWRYGPSQFRNPVIAKNLHKILIFGVVMGLVLVWGMETTFFSENIHDLPNLPQYIAADQQGGLFSGWVLEFNMDILLIFMIINRGNIKGQSIYIAIFKTIGTIFAYIISVGIKQNVPIIDWLFWITLVFNLFYIYLVYTYTKAEGINPWKRV